MNTKKLSIKANIKYSRNFLRQNRLPYIFIFLSGLLFFPIQLSKSEEIYLKCTGKYEINRGVLIKPDWEISYLTVNLDGLKSYIYEKGIKKEGRTLIRRNTYTITHRENGLRIKTKYKIHATHGTYLVDYPKSNRILIGNCQKGRG